MQRYKIRCNDCDPKITPHENGKWVRWGDVERLRAELAEAKKFKDGMLDVLGGACPNDHRSTPFEEFKGCTPCLRAELAECKLDAERYRWVLEHWDTGGPDFGKIMFSSTAETLSADIDTARKGEGDS